MSKIPLQRLWDENKERSAQKHSPYNPLTGEGSPIPRVKVVVKDDYFQMWPKEMVEKEAIILALVSLSSIYEYARLNGFDLSDQQLDETLNSLLPLRYRYDFEFWAATCATIYDKETSKPKRLVLRKAQRKLLKVLEEMRRAGVPIRVVLLKARQWGGSTLVQLYMAWIQLFWQVNWNSAICADVEDQANVIRGMYSRMAANHPEHVQKITLKPYERSQKIRVMEERGCVIGVGSMQKPDGLRAFDLKMAHLSEVGLWKKTEGRSPEDLAQTIRAGIPSLPNTVVVLESTAKGVGNFFHREWLAAKNGTGADRYADVFVAWHEIEMYERPVPKSKLKEVVSRFTDYHWWLWEHQGATLEAIYWYMSFKEREQYSDWRMMSEFPSTDTEAFQSTGNRAIPQQYVSYARSTCQEPSLVGELSGKATKGADALKGLKFTQDHTGKLQIWAMPDPLPMKNRYGVFVDIGGRTHSADYSVIKVFDRYWMMEGGRVEVVAVWRGHLDQDLVAWKAAQIGTFYNNALLAVESNSLRKEKENTEGSHFLTVLDEIAPFYPNLFTRTSPDKVKEGAPALYGFHTNTQSRTMIINVLLAALRDREYTERHMITCDEMDTFEVTASGKFEAVEGNKDDCVITTAGGLWLALRHMDPPQLIEFTKRKDNYKHRTEAVF